jgi:hypothetical protein
MSGVLETYWTGLESANLLPVRVGDGHFFMGKIVVVRVKCSS